MHTSHLSQHTHTGAECAPVLPLLDLLGVARAAVAQPLLASLRAQLVAAVARVDAATLDTLLGRTFPYLALAELRPVALAVLSAHAAIPPAYLRQIAAHADVYGACPLSVKQQVWFVDARVLARELDPLIERYSNAWWSQYGSGSNGVGTSGNGSNATGSTTTIPEATASTSLMKRQEVVREVTRLVGTSFEVYREIIASLYAEYARTGNALLCALRCDVLMGVYGSGASVVYGNDACHAFVLFLNKCVRDRVLDAGLVRELRAACAALLARAAATDAAVALADPRVIALFVRKGVLAARDVLASGGHNPFAPSSSSSSGSSSSSRHGTRTRSSTRRNSGGNASSSSSSTSTSSSTTTTTTTTISSLCQSLSTDNSSGDAEEPLPQAVLALVCALLPLAGEARALVRGAKHATPEGPEGVAAVLFHLASTSTTTTTTTSTSTEDLERVLRASRAARRAYAYDVLAALEAGGDARLASVRPRVAAVLAWPDTDLAEVPHFFAALSATLAARVQAASQTSQMAPALVETAQAALEGLVAHAGALPVALDSALRLAAACVAAPAFPRGALLGVLGSLVPYHVQHPAPAPDATAAERAATAALWRALQHALAADGDGDGADSAQQMRPVFAAAATAIAQALDAQDPDAMH